MNNRLNDYGTIDTKSIVATDVSIMMFMVNDEILERLLCSQCNKYLSVKPIKVYPDRSIKCGRCSTADDLGTVSLFGVLADRALFRCVNRFDGCIRLLSYDDVEQHEKECTGRMYECPCCLYSTFKGNGWQLYVHFKRDHALQLIVNNPVFNLEIDNESLTTYLYRKNDLLFIINVRFRKTDQELVLDVVLLGSQQDASDISQTIVLRSLEGKMRFQSQRTGCGSMNGDNSQRVNIKINSNRYVKNVVVCKIILDTEKVERLLVLPTGRVESKKDVNKSDSVEEKKMPEYHYRNRICPPPPLERGGFQNSNIIDGKTKKNFPTISQRSTSSYPTWEIKIIQ